MKKLRELILRSSFESQEGHVPSALSILDILWILYDKVLNVSPTTAKNPERDRFFLSKGHAALGLYAVLAAKGFIEPEELNSFCKMGSRLGGHPDRNKVLGVEASTGSLGHGLPMAVGVALGQKINRKKAKTFVLIGDGESNEGSIWESALLASHHGLENLCCIVDYNHSTDRALQMGDIASKFSAFGWDSVILNGHDHMALEKAFLQRPLSGRPFAVVAETIKGYGIKSMEGNPAWHHRFPKADELPSLVAEINSEKT